MPEKQQILNLVKAKSPIIPNQIKKELGGDTYLISAYLSELAQDGLVKISHTKIGSSPTYYASGQEFKLQDLKKYLNPKDQNTFDILRQKKILRDKTQEMLIRVGLRNIKDFAKPIEVKVQDGKEIFWRWYLTPIDEAEKLIKEHFSDKKEPARKTEPKLAQREKKIEPKKEAQNRETQTRIQEKRAPSSDFMKEIYDYFDEKKIEMINEEIIRKNSDIEFEIAVPSAVGKVRYFCKAKSKKKCNDGDLSSAYLKGQMKKLPVIFITTGDITKKAREKLNDEFRGLILKEL